jgi:hypothetical protein
MAQVERRRLSHELPTYGRRAGCHTRSTKRTMYYEPDTIWGRTVQGEKEVAAAKSGLSLGQRRLLTMLDSPRTFAALAAKHQMEVTRLEQELIRLAQLRLVAYQRPGTEQPRTAPQFFATTRQAPAPHGFELPPWPVCLGAMALGIGLVLLVVA